MLVVGEELAIGRDWIFMPAHKPGLPETPIASPSVVATVARAAADQMDAVLWPRSADLAED